MIDTIAIAVGWMTLLVCVPLNIVNVVLLAKKLGERPDLAVLRERLRVAVVLLTVLFVFGLIFVNNDRPFPPLDVEMTKLITRSIMLVLGIVPAVGWILLYRKTRPKP